MRKLISVLLLSALLLTTLVGCGVGRGIAVGSSADTENVALSASSGLGDVRVMSFNIQQELPTDETLKNNRLNAVVQEILSYKPDLLGTQEDNLTWVTHFGGNGNAAYDDGNKGNNFAVGALGSDYKVISYDLAGGTNNLANGTERCAIFYNTKTLRLLDSGHSELSYDRNANHASLSWADIQSKYPELVTALDLTEERAKPNKSYAIPYADKSGSANAYIFTNRRMTWGIFEDQDGNVFLYVNTHLTHRSQTGDIATNNPAYLQMREAARIAEWDILQAEIAEAQAIYKADHGTTEDLPVFITGDMNDVLASNTYSYILSTGYENSSKEAIIRRGQDGTWNNAFNTENAGKEVDLQVKDKIGTTTLDYCFISENDFTVEQYQVGDGRVQLTGGTAGKYVYTSDHLPIIVDLTVGAPDNTLVKLQKPLATDNGTGVSIYSGTPDTSWYTGNKSEYILTTADQLMGFQFLRSETCNFEGVTIKLGANMVINQGNAENYADVAPSHTWRELNSSHYFQGTFDGQGHYISGVYMAPSGGAKGLLGGLGGNAVIQNFSLVNSYMDTPDVAEKTRYGTIAALVASNSNITIHNVYSEADIGEQSHTFGMVGGILGLVANDATVTLDHCIYNGSIEITGNYAGGMIGQVTHTAAKVYINECVNTGSIKASNYGGGLIGGVSKAKTVHIQDSAMLGKLDALQYSGGLVGAIENCGGWDKKVFTAGDFVIHGCVVDADLDFSRIASIDAAAQKYGCQVGGIVGRTYNVTGYVNNCAVYGSMKATKAITTEMPDNISEGGNGYGPDYDDYCSGGIFGFNSKWSDDVAATGEKFSCIHIDHVAVSMDMTDVDSYFGGSRNTPINSTFSKISFGDNIYDTEKIGSMPLYGLRVDKDRRLDHSGEKNSQIGNSKGLATVNFLDKDKALAVQSHNYYDWYMAYTLWSETDGGYIVPNDRVKAVIGAAGASEDLDLVAYQTKNNGNGTKDYRYVAAVRNCDHAGIGFNVTISYGSTVRTETAYCKTVYPSVAGEGTTYSASEFGADYLATLVIKNVPDNVTNILVEITPIGSDGTTVYDDHITNVFMINMQ